MPKVSVIIPNYNHALFLPQRIESILQQTFQDFELIILDDCSKDNSKAVIERYRNHPKVSLIVYNEVNSGSPFKQWEKGIGFAKGDYVWMAESDDFCEPTLLETLINGAAENPKVTVAYCQSVSVQDTNEILRLTPQAKWLEEHMNGVDYINQYLIYYSAICNASMAIFKKETFNSISKDFTQFRFCGDWLFWAEMAGKGDVFISGRLLNYFRFHSHDVSTGMYATGRNYIEQFKCLLLMKEKFAVPDDIYKQSLSFYTNEYRIRKKNFSPDVIALIDEQLNKPENKKHKLYWQKKWLLNRGRKVFQKTFEIIDKK